MCRKKHNKQSKKELSSHKTMIRQMATATARLVTKTQQMRRPPTQQEQQQNSKNKKGQDEWTNTRQAELAEGKTTKMEKFQKLQEQQRSEHDQGMTTNIEKGNCSGTATASNETQKKTMEKPWTRRKINRTWTMLEKKQEVKRNWWLGQDWAHELFYGIGSEAGRTRILTWSSDQPYYSYYPICQISFPSTVKFSSTTTTKLLLRSAEHASAERRETLPAVWLLHPE